MSRSAVQPWLNEITLMQQSVLLSAIRGPDGMPKRHKCKPLIRWYRRCILLSAFDGKILDTPVAPGGGSFTGPCFEFADWEDVVPSWPTHMISIVSDFVDARDELPAHYTTHFMHAAEILGYKHPDPKISQFWRAVYLRMVNALHLSPEAHSELDRRLGDNEDQWALKADESATCSD